MLQWRPHLNPLGCSLVILAGTLWLYWLYGRLRRRFPRNRARLILLPKLLLLWLLLIALFEPVSALEQKEAVLGKLLVVLDTSSSMDVVDSPRGSRIARARNVLDQWKGALPAGITLDTLEFDTQVRQRGAVNPARGMRGTDLGGCLLSLSERADLASFMGIVLMTDGGDEPVESAALPLAPLSVIGFGTAPSSWNDVAIAHVLCPDTAEKEVDFEITADLSAHTGGGGSFAQKLARATVQLDRQAGGGWEKVAAQTIDLSSRQGQVKFAANSKSTGLERYRITVEPISGELSSLNNSQTVAIDVQKKSLHLLYFTRELGPGFKMLRNELGRDPGLAFTALFRTVGERFTLQGARLPGDANLEAGFPSLPKAMEIYDAIIIDSFPVEDCSPAQMQALIQYVEQGGSAIFLGGEASFGRGGYAQTPLAALFPWCITAGEPEPAQGNFPVSVPPSAAGHPILAGVQEVLEPAGALIRSVNQVTELKAGATALVNARLGNRTMPLIAVQAYGKGQVMGVASDTLWKWATQPEPLRSAYGRLWRQAVRNLSGKDEGGRNLLVKWDKAHYRPGEAAVAEIRVMGQEKAERVRFSGSLSMGNQTRPLLVEPSPGQHNGFSTRLQFRERGDCNVRLVAYQGDQVLESYEKNFSVTAGVAEGARLEIDEPFLKKLAERGGGTYLPEGEADTFIRQSLRERSQKSIVTESSLVQRGPYFILLFLLVLVIEWTLRRKLNLLLLVLMGCRTGAAESQPREGTIQFSNGEVVRGLISIAPGGGLKMQAGGQLHAIPFDRVQEIRLEPEQEELAQKWRFVEAGQAAKEKEGRPYPLRSLRATLVMAGGQTLTGHLYTTTLYLQGDDRTRKVVLYAKQRGQEGETLESLVYPAQVTLKTAAGGSEDSSFADNRRLKVHLPGLQPASELAVLSRGALIRFEAKPPSVGGRGASNENAAAGANQRTSQITHAQSPIQFRLASSLTPPFFIAIRTGDRIVAGWPKATNETVGSLVSSNVAFAEDFFDQRQLLGIFWDEPNTDVYSLLLLWRHGPTTLPAARSHPWRLEILRWKYAPPEKRLLLAGRGYFFRGILAGNESPPAVALTEALWHLRKEGEGWMAGGE